MPGSSIIAKTTDMVRSGREVEERRTDYVCVLVLVDVTAPKTLAIPVRDAFDPRMPTSEVRVVAAGSKRDLLAPTLPDVCVAVMGRDEDAIAGGVCELAAAGVPVALVVESALDVPPLRLGETAANRVSVISATNPEVLVDRLAEWLVSATDKSIAFAANFPFCRRAKVRELINEYALEAAVGTAKAGPRGELPSLAVNQARLALAIAAVNGQPLALGRIPEVLSAVGAGFGSRMFANKALGKIPLVGWVFQAGFGYLGTQATGMSLQHRFDKRSLKATGERSAPITSTSKSGRHAGASAMKLLAEVTSAHGQARKEAPGASVGRDVRLLPSSKDGGYLVYEAGGSQ